MALTDAAGAALSGGLSAAGSLTSGIMSAIQGKKDRESYEQQQHLNRVFENEQASKAYQRQVEFWKMQNEYNSPAEQMARLRAAGLNPDLAIGGNVQNSAGGLSSVAKGTGTGSSYAPPIDYSAFANAAQAAAATIRSVAESENIEADTRGKELDNALKAPKAEMAKEFVDWELKHIKKDWHVKSSEQSRNISAANESDQQAAYFKTMDSVERLKGVKLEAQKPYFDMIAKYEVDTAQAQYILTLGNIFNVVSDAELKRSQKAYWDKNKEMLQKQMTYQDYLNEMERMRKDLLGVVHGNVTSDPTYFNTMERIRALTSALGSILGGSGSALIQGLMNR
jgi:hypothetical protein